MPSTCAARASRRYQWSAKRPLNAQNQTYYIAPVYYEWNVFELFERKINAALRADEQIFGGGDAPLLERAGDAVASYMLASADLLGHIGDDSVDYVFTDPPFGSNIFYSDMSLFHEAWLGRTTNNDSAAVVHTTGRRKNGAAERYEKLLRDSFTEAFRILKPGRYMSVVFGNSSGRIWGLVQRALRDAGFKAAPVHVAILDKGQRSVKGLNSGSEGVVTVDLIMTVQKPAEAETANNARALTNGDAADLIREAIAELSIEDSRNPSYVYARILSKAIRKHIVLDGLQLGDVLIALRKAGYVIDQRRLRKRWRLSGSVRQRMSGFTTGQNRKRPAAGERLRSKYGRPFGHPDIQGDGHFTAVFIRRPAHGVQLKIIWFRVYRLNQPTT